MDKLKMHSSDITQQNIEKLLELFPNCRTEKQGNSGKLERGIDFDLLKQELSKTIVEGPKERYQLNWPGKKEALLTANAPIAKTLRPCREESVDFDTTENLFIEGDNLEALKLLQETYLGKVKMIYIDPPYNTGEDFIYEDDFSVDAETYLINSNQKDDSGNRLIANTDTNGRFHSDWLTNMYMRLKLARTLLSDEGVIFISIGDHEVHNLRSICDEVFGAENFEGHIHWRRRHNQPNDPTKMIGIVAEHILAFSKNKLLLRQAGVGKVELTGTFSNPDNDPRGAWASKPWKVGSDQSGSKYSIELPSGEVAEEDWMGEESTYLRYLEEGRILFPNSGRGLPRKKYYEFERAEEGQCATNWWNHDQFGHNQEGNADLTELMDGIKNTFSNPKPAKLIRNLIGLSNCKDKDVVLDFFAGSGTIYHAAFQSGLSLKVIGVQLPEVLSETVKKHQPAISYCKNNNFPFVLSEVTKDRIRRAGKKINEENSEAAELDTGFRVLKIDSSNMNEVHYTPDAISKSDLLTQIDHIKTDRTAEDLLFQVMLDWGVDLSLPIRSETIEGKAVYFVNDDDLIACFDKDIDEALIKTLAGKEPLRVVFRDDGFVSDSVKINAEQIFKQLSPTTDIKAI